jgi:hypothetical protein
VNANQPIQNAVDYRGSRNAAAPKSAIICVTFIWCRILVLLQPFPMRRIIKSAIVARSGYLPYFDADGELFLHEQPESEISNPEFLDELRGLPIVCAAEHPDEVTQDNLRALRDGTLGLNPKVVPATEFAPMLVEVDVILETERAIAAYEDGWRLLSLGCSGTLEDSNKFVDSIPVTTIRRNLKPNHLLLCGDLNRSGGTVAIKDSVNPIASKVGDTLAYSHAPSKEIGVLRAIENGKFVVFNGETSYSVDSENVISVKTGDSMTTQEKDKLAQAQADLISARKELKTLQDSIPELEAAAAQKAIAQARLHVLADSLEVKVTAEMLAEPQKTADALAILSDSKIYGLDLDMTAEEIQKDPAKARREIVEKVYNLSVGLPFSDSLGELTDAQAQGVIDKLYRGHIQKLANSLDEKTEDSILVTEETAVDIASFAGFGGSSARMQSVLRSLAAVEDAQFGKVM